MNKDYIPVLVEKGDKKEIWIMDVTTLSVAELIELRKKLMDTPYNKKIQSLDSIIKRNIETIIPSHNINGGSYIRTYKKNKKEEKFKKKIKIRRR